MELLSCVAIVVHLHLPIGSKDGNSMEDRVKTGINTLDAMLGGGLYRGSACMVKGAPGTGKTTLALQFLAEGIESGQPALYVTFEEFSSSLYRDAKSIGIDLDRYEKDGMLKMIFTTPEVFLSMVKKPGGEFDEAVLGLGVKRAVVDAFNHIENMVEEPKRMRNLGYFLVNSFRRHQVTSLLLQEDRLFLGDVGGLETGFPYIVDTIIQLKYVELESRVRKALLVLKHRASRHSNEILEYMITDRGLLIGGQYEADHLISGSATRRPAVDSLVSYLSDTGTSMDVSVKLIEDTLVKMGESLPEEHYKTTQDFLKAIEKGTAGISKLESKPTQRTNGVYATSACPFRANIIALSNENHDALVALTDLYKKKYPYLAVVHPFCVCHQNVRELILSKTYVAGKPIKSETLACKSSVLGGIGFGTKAMNSTGLSEKQVLELIGSDVCLYTLGIDEPGDSIGNGSTDSKVRKNGGKQKVKE